MEEKGVRVIVGLIVGVILLITILSIVFIFKKFDNDKKRNTTTTTVPTEYKTVSCYKIDDNDYTKRQDITLTYNFGELYQLDVKYTYTYKRSYDKDKIVTELRSINKLEEKLFSTGVKTTFDTLERGGVSTLSYDLTIQNIRLYANSKYFHNNIYLKDSEYKDYMASRNYICE